MLRQLTCGILCVALLTPAQAAVPRDETPLQRPAPIADSQPEPVPIPISAEEKESLERRSEVPGHEVAGGALSNEHLTYIVIALAAAVLVLVLK